jgi:uncharacterized membrane protein
MNTQGNAARASNPYAPPSALVEDQLAGESGESAYIPGGRQCSAGRGKVWISEAWDLFKQSPFLCIILVILSAFISLVLQFLLNALPPKHILGPLISPLITPMLGAGVILACSELRKTGTLDIGNLFAPIGTHAGPLVLQGFLSFVLLIACMAPIGIGAAVVFPMIGKGLISVTTGIGLGLIAGLVLIGICFIVGSATVYAPALIVLHDLKPIEAMTASLKGGLKNWLPLTISGLLMAMIVLFSAIPLGLGLFVSYPLAILTVYTSYRDIFTAS